MIKQGDILVANHDFYVSTARNDFIIKNKFYIALEINKNLIYVKIFPILFFYNKTSFNKI